MFVTAEKDSFTAMQWHGRG